MRQTILITASGHARLNEELKDLKTVKRPAAVEAIVIARGHGDLSENAEYHAARETQAFLETRIAEVESILANAEIFNPSVNAGQDLIRFGAHVAIKNLENDEKSNFQIVGEPEADIENGRLSLLAPLARALVGKSTGDTVKVTTPGGTKSYSISEISYPSPDLNQEKKPG